MMIMMEMEMDRAMYIRGCWLLLLFFAERDLLPNHLRL